MLCGGMVNISKGLTATVFILVILLLFTFYLSFNYRQKNVALQGQIDSLYNQTLDGKPFVDISFNSWGELQGDSSKLIFSYWVNNYGSIEAKDVQVRCNVQDTDGAVLFFSDDNIGNIPAHWNDYKETTTTKSAVYLANQERNIKGTCFIRSCANCEILYKRVPSLVISYEGK